MNGGSPLRALLTLVSVLALALLASRCRAAQDAPSEPRRVPIHRVFPHDATAYTQGLVWHDGELYESTGQYGESTLRRVDLESGEVRQEHRLADTEFGEGLARVGDGLIQLTWKAGRAWEYDLETFEPRREFYYQGPGWGLCHDGSQLWMSDGSDRLTRRDPATFDILGVLSVTAGGQRLFNLNELECAEGWIFANVFTTDRIVRIDPLTGEVTETIDASGLLTAEERLSADVLNGIAYDPEREVFYLTGKDWPKLFEVTFE